MNLTVFAGILHAITMATARRASLGEKTMQAAGKADEPDKAKRVKTRGYQSAVVTYIQKEANFTTSNRAADHFHPLIGSANMNLTVFAGILHAITMATARRASLGEKTMQAAGKADEPVEAMRDAARPASLVEKIMRAANEADEPDKAKR